ncbi:MAG: exodeoxyribonuclease VII large subunit [Clostridia bacterium]|nr:exodeoxyribonuclease VII large subunit [Clostridia bacterium]
MSVSELNAYIKNMFDSSRLLSSLSVSGEISNFTNHRSGHLYFSLKDNDGQIRAVMFRSSAAHLKFMPENGMRVTVRGSVSVFARDGSYQLYVSSMQPDGIGALYLAYEQLKARLEAEGLFDSSVKQPIPELPSRIGVITSPTGAAVRDIINVLGRRYPLARVYLYPALVQGDGAVDSLIHALDYFDSSRLADVIIIGRGGGSIEDLWAFNSEALARRIYDMGIPVISAVGHETDFTICDFVADLRAPTPSAAAELAVADVRELRMRIDNSFDRLDRALVRRCERCRERLDSLYGRLSSVSPDVMIYDGRRTLGQMSSMLDNAIFRILKDKRGAFSTLLGELNGLNPLATLARGYSIAEREGRTVVSVTSLGVDDEIRLRFSDGAVKARITEIE